MRAEAQQARRDVERLSTELQVREAGQGSGKEGKGFAAMLARLDQLRTFFGFFAVFFVVKSRVSIAAV